MQNNQFAIYRVDILKAGKDLKHLPYNKVREKKIPVRIENYKQMHIGKMESTDRVVDIWKRTKVYTEVSDVLVVNQKGEISCYYVDEEHLRRINGFIQLKLDADFFHLRLCDAVNVLLIDDFLLFGDFFEKLHFVFSSLPSIFVCAGSQYIG